MWDYEVLKAMSQKEREDEVIHKWGFESPITIWYFDFLETYKNTIGFDLHHLTATMCALEADPCDPVYIEAVKSIDEAKNIEED